MQVARITALLVLSYGLSLPAMAESLCQQANGGDQACTMPMEPVQSDSSLSMIQKKVLAEIGPAQSGQSPRKPQLDAKYYAQPDAEEDAQPGLAHPTKPQPDAGEDAQPAELDSTDHEPTEPQGGNVKPKPDAGEGAQPAALEELDSTDHKPTEPQGGKVTHLVRRKARKAKAVEAAVDAKGATPGEAEAPKAALAEAEVDANHTAALEAAAPKAPAEALWGKTFYSGLWLGEAHGLEAQLLGLAHLSVEGCRTVNDANNFPTAAGWVGDDCVEHNSYDQFDQSGRRIRPDEFNLAALFHNSFQPAYRRQCALVLRGSIVHAGFMTPRRDGVTDSLRENYGTDQAKMCKTWWHPDAARQAGELARGAFWQRVKAYLSTNGAGACGGGTYVVGHSVGGAFASILAKCLSNRQTDLASGQVQLYTFGAPGVAEEEDYPSSGCYQGKRFYNMDEGGRTEKQDPIPSFGFRTIWRLYHPRVPAIMLSRFSREETDTDCGMARTADTDRKPEDVSRGSAYNRGVWQEEYHHAKTYLERLTWNKPFPVAPLLEGGWTFADDIGDAADPYVVFDTPFTVALQQSIARHDMRVVFDCEVGHIKVLLMPRQDSTYCGQIVKYSTGNSWREDWGEITTFEYYKELCVSTDTTPNDGRHMKMVLSDVDRRKIPDWKGFVPGRKTFTATRTSTGQHSALAFR